MLTMKASLACCRLFRNGAMGLQMTSPSTAAALPSRRAFASSVSGYERFFGGSAPVSASPEACDRLWPSFAVLRNDLLSNYGTSLPELVKTALLDMEDREGDDGKDEGAASFNHNNSRNIERIGVMTRTTNSFLEGQMKAKSSEAVYTPRTLDLYDAIVWDFNSPFHWRIHPYEIDDLYRRGLEGSHRHCEVAVGTGLFLRDWAKKANDGKRPLLEHLTLVDLSLSSLEGCHQRLLGEEYFSKSMPASSIEKLQVDILEPPPNELLGTFDSVAANFLLHCLHGESLLDKKSAVASCASLLKKDGGVFFGSTILGGDLLDDAAQAGPYATATIRHYNKIGIFGNSGDSFDDMVAVLEELFINVSVFKVGYCAVWLAKNPKR